MTDKELKLKAVASENEGSVSQKPDLTLVEAITMSIVAILAVAVGTVYGTILF